LSWPVRSRCLYHSRGTLSATTHSLGVVPTGKTWLVKEFAVTNITGSSSSIVVYHLRGTAYVPFWIPGSVPNGTLVRAGPFGTVLAAGDDLVIYTPIAGEYAIAVYGAQLG